MGRKFSDYCREILLNGTIAAVPKMTDNEKEAIAILGQTAKFYALISNLTRSRTRIGYISQRTFPYVTKEAFKRF